MIAVVATSGEDKTKPYVDAIMAHGGRPRVLRPGDPFHKLGLGGLMLTGGGDLGSRFYEHRLSSSERKTLGKIEPERDKYELELLAWASRNDIPTLGICRGCQVMNAAARGKIIPDIPLWQKLKISNSKFPILSHRQKSHPSQPTHEISIKAGSHLQKILKGRRKIMVNSSHHQAVATCAPSLKVTANAPDGIVEAVEDASRTFWIGVQFHPERMWKKLPIFSRLFERLIQCAAKRGEG